MDASGKTRGEPQEQTGTFTWVSPRNERSEDSSGFLRDLAEQTEEEYVRLSLASLPLVQAAVESEWNMLDFLDKHADVPQECTPMRIADEIVVTKARVTQICKSLESQGFVERHQDETDGRKYYFTLTDAGRNSCREHRDNMRRLFEECLSRLSASDAREVLRLTARLSQVFAQVGEERMSALLEGRD